MKMKAYINGTGIISPQQTRSGEGLPQAPVDYKTNYLTCIEPDYTQWISPQYLRRMSRILKMGAAAAMMALKDASLERPDAVITGTGYGCLEDTATFLTKITDLHEEALNPTPFMQSTHNTIGSQIALLLRCQGYNQTYAHGAFSFEQSLLDTLMLLAEDPGRHILTGGVDELTATSHAIHSRFDKYRRDGSGTLSLLSNPQSGTVAGEGAAWFALSGTPGANFRAAVTAVKTLYLPGAQHLMEGIALFLHENELDPAGIDLLLAGFNGDIEHDRRVNMVASMFGSSSIGAFKHLCGEYSVASSFAMWLGAAILEQGHVPGAVLLKNRNRPAQSVLIYNAYAHDHHTLILLQVCRDIKS